MSYEYVRKYAFAILIIVFISIGIIWDVAVVSNIGTRSLVLTTHLMPIFTLLFVRSSSANLIIQILIKVRAI